MKSKERGGASNCSLTRIEHPTFHTHENPPMNPTCGILVQSAGSIFRRNYTTEPNLPAASLPSSFRELFPPVRIRYPHPQPLPSPVPASRIGLRQLNRVVCSATSPH